jgi:hypothetical protein
MDLEIKLALNEDEAVEDNQTWYIVHMPTTGVLLGPFASKEEAVRYLPAVMTMTLANPAVPNGRSEIAVAEGDAEGPGLLNPCFGLDDEGGTLDPEAATKGVLKALKSGVMEEFWRLAEPQPDLEWYGRLSKEDQAKVTKILQEEMGTDRPIDEAPLENVLVLLALGMPMSTSDLRRAAKRLAQDVLRRMG